MGYSLRIEQVKSTVILGDFFFWIATNAPDAQLEEFMPSLKFISPYFKKKTTDFEENIVNTIGAVVKREGVNIIAL